MRLLYLTVLLFLTSIVYGQKSELLQNVNERAKELSHYLNKTEDSIIFKCDRTIYEVMIFNDDFERIIKVKNTEAKVLIADIPVGRYAIETVLRDKLIVITLLRNETFDLIEPTPLLTDYTPLLAKTLTQPKHTIVSTVKPTTELKSFGKENNLRTTDLKLLGKKALPINTTSNTKSVLQKKITIARNLLTLKNLRVKAAKLNKPKSRIKITKTNDVISKYWVLYKINNGSSSEKVLKMADQKTVDRLIKKIKIDMKTSTGRLNELTVWRIYNPSHFVLHKRKNKTNYITTNSDSFNIVPYYQQENSLDKR